MLPTTRRLLLVLLSGALLAPAPAAQAASRQGSGGTAPQWYLRVAKGTGAVAAWPTTEGSDVLVAVIDSGVDLKVADLAPNAWTNPGEIAGNGVDDDGNGYVDDAHGWDFVAGDADPADENGHGTHVAGLIAARGANTRGVAGVGRQAKIMALRVLDRNNDGTTTDVAAAIRYAVKQGARVVNLSLNSARPDPELEAAIAAAEAADVLVVVAAGNQGADLDTAPSFPACSTRGNVLSVAALTRGGSLAAFSNRGASCVALAAPGAGLLSTRRGGGYESRSGTSMAAPQVAGAAALLLAAHPSLHATEVRAALLAGAAPLRRPTARLRRLDVPGGLAAVPGAS